MKKIHRKYLKICEGIFLDTSMSPRCFRVILYILGSNEKWESNPQILIKSLKKCMGRTAIRKAIEEAIELGYVRQEEYKVGNFTHYKFQASDKPIFKVV